METSIKRIRALFDTARFYEDVDRIRQERGMSWPQAAAEVGFGLAWIRQPSRQDNPRIDILTPIAAWAGLSLDAYIQVFDQAGNPLPRATPKIKQPRPRFRLGNQSPGYDVVRFYADLDQVRQTRGMSWHGVWRAIPSTAVPLALSMFITQQIALAPRVCEVLANWADLDFSSYVEDGRHHEE